LFLLQFLEFCLLCSISVEDKTEGKHLNPDEGSSTEQNIYEPEEFELDSYERLVRNETESDLEPPIMAATFICTSQAAELKSPSFVHDLFDFPNRLCTSHSDMCGTKDESKICEGHDIKLLTEPTTNISANRELETFAVSEADFCCIDRELPVPCADILSELSEPQLTMTFTTSSVRMDIYKKLWKYVCFLIFQWFLPFLLKIQVCARPMYAQLIIG
jgi:hypothetical protein